MDLGLEKFFILWKSLCMLRPKESLCCCSYCCLLFLLLLGVWAFALCSLLRERDYETMILILLLIHLTRSLCVYIYVYVCVCCYVCMRAWSFSFLCMYYVGIIWRAGYNCLQYFLIFDSPASSCLLAVQPFFVTEDKYILWILEIEAMTLHWLTFHLCVRIYYFLFYFV